MKQSRLSTRAERVTELQLCQVLARQLVERVERLRGHYVNGCDISGKLLDAWVKLGEAHQALKSIDEKAL